MRSLCCLVTLPEHRILIDPGIALGYQRDRLLPHPKQIAVGRRIRQRILAAMAEATDVVFSHYHGDHVPLTRSNPYQLPMAALPRRFATLRAWAKSAADLGDTMRDRYQDLARVMGAELRVAEGLVEGALAFSSAVPHGEAGGPMGSAMMMRIELHGQVFVHASDIQLLDAATVDALLDWHPSIVLAAGPPLYLGRLRRPQRELAFANARRLAEGIETLILDHHLMRDPLGGTWLEEVGQAAGRPVCCAADFMGRPRQLLEAERRRLYSAIPVPGDWHERYARGLIEPDSWLAGR